MNTKDATSVVTMYSPPFSSVRCLHKGACEERDEAGKLITNKQHLTEAERTSEGFALYMERRSLSNQASVASVRYKYHTPKGEPIRTDEEPFWIARHENDHHGYSPDKLLVAAIEKTLLSIK